MSVTIEVTQEDIDQARKRRSGGDYVVCHDCAIAVAVARTLSRPIQWAFEGGWDTSINHSNIARYVQAHEDDQDMVSKHVDQFDAETGHSSRSRLMPFTFELEVYDAISN